MAAPPRAALALAAAVAASSITPTATAWQTLTIDKATPVKQTDHPPLLPGPCCQADPWRLTSSGASMQVDTNRTIDTRTSLRFVDGGAMVVAAGVTLT